MAIEILTTLREQLPDAFEPQESPEGWEHDWYREAVEAPASEQPTALELEAWHRGMPEFVREWELRRGAQTPGGPSDQVASVLGGFPPFAGSPGASWNAAHQPPPDRLAFYLPFHLYPTWWGIYLTLDGVLHLTRLLHRLAGGALSRPEALVTSRLFLYHHASYHYRIELFAAHLETAHDTPVFVEGFLRAYRAEQDSDRCLEEALATAHAVAQVSTALEATPGWREAAETALAQYIAAAPPPYRQARDLLAADAFQDAEHRLAARYHAAGLPALPLLAQAAWSDFAGAFTSADVPDAAVRYVLRRESELCRRREVWRSGRVAEIRPEYGRQDDSALAEDHSEAQDIDLDRIEPYEPRRVERYLTILVEPLELPPSILADTLLELARQRRSPIDQITGDYVVEKVFEQAIGLDHCLRPWPLDLLRQWFKIRVLRGLVHMLRQPMGGASHRRGDAKSSVPSTALSRDDEDNGPHPEAKPTAAESGATEPAQPAPVPAPEPEAETAPEEPEEPAPADSPAESPPQARGATPPSPRPSPVRRAVQWFVGWIKTVVDWVRRVFEPPCFTVFAPPKVEPGTSFFVRVFVHCHEDSATVSRLAEEYEGDSPVQGSRPMPLGRRAACRVTFRLDIPDLGIEGEEKSAIRWRHPEEVRFKVHLPSSHPPGQISAIVRASYKGLPVADLEVMLTVVRRGSLADDEEQEELRGAMRGYRYGFVSYSRRDLDRVSEWLQLLDPFGLPYFFDKTGIQRGEEWEPRILEGLDRADLFLLFWSWAASTSEWVDREARRARDRQLGSEDGRPVIHPILLDKPPPPPPDFLSHIQFDDPWPPRYRKR